MESIVEKCLTKSKSYKGFLALLKENGLEIKERAGIVHKEFKTYRKIAKCDLSQFSVEIRDWERTENITRFLEYTKRCFGEVK